MHRSLGITSFAELREAAPQPRLATSVDDGENFVGFAAGELLARSGVDVLGWGGEFLRDERPFENDHIQHITRRFADRGHAFLTHHLPQSR
ncbi:hypothetical protein ACFVH6_25385 [Spirillospora sp. NPDC127200]